MSVCIPGSTFEKGIETRKGPIQQSDEIVFEVDFQPYILVVLAAARLECLPDLICRSVTFKISPTVKTVVCSFHGVQFVRFALPE